MTLQRLIQLLNDMPRKSSRLTMISLSLSL